MQKQKENCWSELDVALVCGIKVSSLRKWNNEKEIAKNKQKKKRGRPEAIPPGARWKLRKCYQDHYGQWGPKVLQCWAKRQRLGSYAADTIARVIADLKPPPEKKPKPIRYEIAAPMVMWSEDGTGFKDGNRKREAMILQDECARYKVHTRLADGPANEEDVLIYLEEAFQKYGAPLILKHDNIAYQNTDRVKALCEKYGVMLLNSPLRYPMYNGKKERSMRDIKSYVRALHLNKVSSSLDTKLKLAVHDLNKERPRPVLGGMTAKEVFFNQRQKLPSRDQFQIRVKTARLKWEEKSTDRKQMDSARRKAIEEVLLHYDLLKLKGNTSTDLNSKTVTH